MKLTRLALFLAVAGFGLSPVSGDEQPAKNQKKIKSTPWHLIDTWWDIGEEAAFESLAVDVTISEDVPDSVNLYIAPIGWAHLSKSPFYGGFQTNSDGNTRKDPNIRRLGPGFLFSMWGERGLDAIKPSEGGFLQSSGHEGDFVSVRRPFAWKKGKYTYQLIRMSQESIKGKPYTWVGAFVYSHEKDENIFIGALRFKGEKLVLERSIVNFVEIYGVEKPVSEIPKLTVTFGPPVVNGSVPKKISAVAQYDPGIPDYAEAVAKDGSLVVTVGKPVEKREQRFVKLIESGK